MIEEKFAQGSSFLHQRDPRAKLVAALLFTITVALLDSTSALWLCCGVSLSLLLLARLNFSAIGKRLLLVNSFTLFLWITLPLTYETNLLSPAETFSLSSSGIALAATITLKTNTIIPAIIALLSTSSIAQLGHSLNRLRFPKKLCFLLLFSYRYVFVIYQEYRRLLRAAQIRSFVPQTTLHTYKTFAYLFAMTLVKSYNRSQRVYQAMQLRGFNGNLVSLQHYDYSIKDAMLMALILITVFLALYLNFTH